MHEIRTLPKIHIGTILKSFLGIPSSPASKPGRPKRKKADPGRPAPGTIYISSDGLERSEAFQLGYDAVVQHPIDVTKIRRGGVIVIDFDRILFDEKAEAVKLARRALRRGLHVAIHTYNEDHPLLAELTVRTRFIWAKRHVDLLAALAVRGVTI